MSRFVVLYRAPMTAKEQMSKATPDDGKAWMDWFGQSQFYLHICR